MSGSLKGKVALVTGGGSGIGRASALALAAAEATVVGADVDENGGKETAEQIGAALIPFLLAGVGDRPELNLPDGNHPTVAGHKVVAENVWAVLGPLLEQKR